MSGTKFSSTEGRKNTRTAERKVDAICSVDYQNEPNPAKKTTPALKLSTKISGYDNPTKRRPNNNFVYPLTSYLIQRIRCRKKSDGNYDSMQNIWTIEPIAVRQ